MDIELEKLKKLEHALCDAIDILRDWQLEEAKPEEEKWIAYLAMPNGNGSYLTACSEDAWNEVKQIFGAKTKLFVGTKSEVEAWYKARQKFTKVIKAWEDGKTIQYLDESTKTWMDLKDYTIAWFTDREYRVKPECPCDDGIYSKACVGCEHSEDGKPRINKNYAEGACKDCLERKKYRPYESSAEMIADFKDRFKVKCPPYCEPLIWLRRKGCEDRHFVFGFKENKIALNAYRTLDEVFEYWTYLDGSPVGMEVKE